MTAYYNEIDPYCCEWLKNLIKEGLIPDGIVDDRDIREVQPRDLAGFSQCHFFAGLGGWAYAARLAGWPDDRPLWTGSCPCQPFSVAGKKQGFQDERDLWPEFHRLIRQSKPPLVVGEQVHSKDGKLWLDRALAQLEGDDYACWAAIAPACGVEAPHLRYRLWFVADAQDLRRSNGHGQPGGRTPLQSERQGGGDSALAHPAGEQVGSARQPWEPRDVGLPIGAGLEGHTRHGGHSGGRPGAARPVGAPGGSFWAGAEWINSYTEGKRRRVKPGIPLLAPRLPGHVDQIRALGNAIVPQLGAEILGAILDMES